MVLKVSDGGYAASGWDPDSNVEVPDLSPLLRHSLHLSQHPLENLLGSPLDPRLSELLDALAVDPDLGADADLDAALTPQVISVLVDQPDRDRLMLAHPSSVELIRWGVDQRPVLTWRPSGSTRPIERVDALDELSAAVTTDLIDHLHSVGELAECIAARVGLPDQVTQTIGAAGTFHDLGKADRRFQRWLQNPSEAPLAKSNVPRSRWRAMAIAAGWPAGARHELLSVQLLDAALAEGLTLADADTVRHLVISHHGHGRPLCPTTTAGPAPIDTTVDFDGRTYRASTDPNADDWDQPRRFQRHCELHGYWGAALLEACLRQADHVVSRATEVI